MIKLRMANCGFGIWSLVIAILCVLCAFVVSFASAESFPNFSYGGGGNWSNGYWRPISITNSAAVQTDYTVQVTLTTAALGNPYTHIKSNGSDIRFTQTHYGTEIPYYIESWVITGTSTIWVKVPSLITNTNTSIYMYYGNISAASVSSPTNTFVNVFTQPGFEAEAGWTYDGSTPGYLQTCYRVVPATDWKTESAGSYFQNVNVKGGYGRESQTVNLPAGNNYKIRFDAQTGQIGWDGYETSYGVIWDDAAGIWSTTQAYTLLLNQETPSLSSGSHIIRFGAWDGGGVYNTPANIYYDNIRVRKYVSPEPSVAAPGTEQMSGNGNYIRLTDPTNVVSDNQTVAMGNSIPYVSFKLTLVNTANTSQTFARWKRFRINKYTAPTATECPSDKIVVQVWAETSKAESLKENWDAGSDTLIQQGNFADGRAGLCWLNMNRFHITTTAQKFYIVFKLANDCPGGSRFSFRVPDYTYLEFEDAAVSNENFD